MRHFLAAQRSGRRSYARPDGSLRGLSKDKSRSVRIIDPTNGSRSHLAGEKSLSDSASVSIAAALNARESLIRVPKTQSAFLRRAQLNASRRSRDVRQHCSLNSWIQTALSNSRNAVSISRGRTAWCTKTKHPPALPPAGSAALPANRGSFGYFPV